MLAPAKSRKATATVSTETLANRIVTIPVDKLHDHPANPKHRVSDDAIAELEKLIDEFGQREPVRVRAIADPVGHFEILSGHRRTAACRLLGRDVNCVVVEANDDEALREVMLGNAERKDLNAIERAELLQVMIDEGIDRCEAGRMFGLESESGIKNTLRLLKLPESIRKLVTDGKLPARTARVLVPWAEAHMILDDLAKQITDDEWALSDLITDSKWSPAASEWRPMDGKTKYKQSWEYDEAVRKFDVDALNSIVREQLGIVSLPLGKNGAVIEIAQNVELFDKLNAPHVKKRDMYGNSKQQKIKPAEGEKLTPAQLKAEEKRKAKEADERLEKRLPIWRRRFIRATLVTQVEPGHIVIAASLPWLIAKAGTSDAGQWMLRAARTLGVATKKEYTGELSHFIASIEKDRCEMVDRLWRVLLWPQSMVWRQGHFEPMNPKDGLSIDLPQDMAIGREYESIDDELRMMMELASIDPSHGWQQAAIEGTPQRALLKEFLDLHTTAQLASLAREWKLTYFAGDKKSIIADIIMAAHLDKRRLAMPKALQEPASKKRCAK